ncbi:unnamed protein product [Moneuplotes crassus]|uniref:Uncharacterized protein n=1 Tax=Euplotes crassus TaxID=5936 RepID=A0AAD1XBJ1_EUPCR|nr:unnamed protein product [Moneuplotes crassus]
MISPQKRCRLNILKQNSAERCKIQHQKLLKGKKDLLCYTQKAIEKNTSEYKKSYSPIFRPLTSKVAGCLIKRSNFITGVTNSLVPDPYLYKKTQQKYSVYQDEIIFRSKTSSISKSFRKSRQDFNTTIPSRLKRINYSIE